MTKLIKDLGKKQKRISPKRIKKILGAEVLTAKDIKNNPRLMAAARIKRKK